MTNGILLISNNKTYSLESIITVYETKMTSNTTPSPLVASASSQHSSNVYPIWKAFNGTTIDANDIWMSNGLNNEYIQINFGSKKNINSLYITSRNHTVLDISTPKDFDILASNDGVIFETVAEIRNQTNWKQNEKRLYRFNKSVNSQYMRIKFLSVNSGTTIAIGEILYAYINDSLMELKSNSLQNFVNYGMNSPIKTNVAFTNKNYILQDEVSEDVSDGLWKTQLDRKPLSIKFD